MFIAMLLTAACSGDEGGSPATQPETVPTSAAATTTEVPADPGSCVDLDNLEIGPFLLVSVEEVREAFPEAADPGPGENYVQLTVSGDWYGFGPLWVHNQIHFAIITSADDFVRHRLGSPVDREADRGERITFTHFYLIDGSTNDLTLVCSTENGPAPMRTSDAQPAP